MRNVALSFVVTAALFSAAPAAAAVTILDANFESGFGPFVPSGQVGIATVADYAVCCGATGDPANHFVAFGSGGQVSGTISAPLNLPIGGIYEMTFNYGALGSGTDTLTITVGGSTTVLTAFANNNLTTLGSATVNINMNQGPTLFTVTSSGAQGADAFIDNIRLVNQFLIQLPPGVPEPSSWAMMLMGFGGIGVAMRRRKVAALA